MTETRIEATRQISQPPAAIFDLLRSPQGHVAIDASGMLQSATGDAANAVGDQFVVHMDRESLGDRPLGKYDVTVTITKFEPAALIEWNIGGFGRSPIGHVYGYELVPEADGTLVTSYCDWSQIPATPEWAAIFPIIPQTALRATLGILDRTLNAGSLNS